jgi:hypothetical protein
MSTIKLKSNLHKLIDRLERDDILQSVHDFLVVWEKSHSEGLWNSLTEDQKSELLIAFEESERGENLVSKEEFFK